MNIGCIDGLSGGQAISLMANDVNHQKKRTEHAFFAE
jgi:uncharacterized protein YoaH (UPF0181 family)